MSPFFIDCLSSGVGGESARPSLVLPFICHAISNEGKHNRKSVGRRWLLLSLVVRGKRPPFCLFEGWRIFMWHNNEVRDFRELSKRKFIVSFYIFYFVRPSFLVNRFDAVITRLRRNVLPRFSFLFPSRFNRLSLSSLERLCGFEFLSFVNFICYLLLFQPSSIVVRHFVARWLCRMTVKSAYCKKRSIVNIEPKTKGGRWQEEAPTTIGGTPK